MSIYNTSPGNLGDIIVMAAAANMTIHIAIAYIRDFILFVLSAANVRVIRGGSLNKKPPTELNLQRGLLMRNAS